MQRTNNSNLSPGGRSLLHNTERVPCTSGRVLSIYRIRYSEGESCRDAQSNHVLLQEIELNDRWTTSISNEASIKNFHLDVFAHTEQALGKVARDQRVVRGARGKTAQASPREHDPHAVHRAARLGA